jgi:hypothetical protein
MESMDVINSVLEFGTDAVLRYRTMSEESDNRIQEYFLRSCIALDLHRRFACCVQLEVLYTDIASYLRVPDSPELTQKFGGCKTDIAMFETGFAPAIIELKILDEDRKLKGTEDDVLKIRQLSEIRKIRGYIGVFICQTSGSLEEQIQRLETVLNRKVYTGTSQRSHDAQWQWCFGCSLVSENPRPDGVRFPCSPVT